MLKIIYKGYEKIAVGAKKTNLLRLILLFSLASFMGAFSYLETAPLCIAVVAAAWLTKRNHLVAFLGAFLGALITLNYYAFFMLSLYFIFCLTWTLWQKNVKDRDKFLMVIAATILAVPVFRFSSTSSCLFGLLNVLLSTILTVLLQNGFFAFSALLKRRFLSQTEQSALCILVCLISIALSPIKIFSLAPFILFATIVSLFAARFLGAYGIALSVFSIAPSAMLMGYDYFIIVGFALCTLAAALFARGGKWAVVSSFIVASIVVCSINAAAMHVLELSVGSFLFALTPKKLESRVFSYVSVKSKGLSAKYKLDSAISRLSFAAEACESFARVSAEDSHKEFSILRDVLENIKSACSNEKKREKFGLTVATSGIAQNKDDQTGDSLAIKNIDESVLIVLSDGMGSGSAASDESMLAIEYFSELIEAGFDISYALTTANELLIKKDIEMYATIDALMFSKTDGTAKLIKMGAPPSFIIRNKNVISINGESLPVGIIKGIDPAVHLCSLKRDDILVMMTDGVFDLLESEIISTLLESAESHQYLDDFTETIMKKAESLGILDDMSIVAVRIENSGVEA